MTRGKNKIDEYRRETNQADDDAKQNYCKDSDDISTVC